jgi:precorrin-6Y C5,15-methyltransferase (decarboxylating)
MRGRGSQRAVVLKGDLPKTLGRIEETEGPVVVLASGDPGFFGIVRLLGERFGGRGCA